MTWEDITDWLDGVLSKIEDLPERAADFQESVREKVSSIAEQVQERDFITKQQMFAVENIEDAVDKWLER